MAEVEIMIRPSIEHTRELERVLRLADTLARNVAGSAHTMKRNPGGKMARYAIERNYRSANELGDEITKLGIT